MNLYKYLEENFRKFSLYSALNLLEYVYSCSIDKIKNLKFYSYINLNNSPEITDITEKSGNMVIISSKPCLLDYLPKFYLDQFLDMDEPSQAKLNDFLNLFTKNLVCLGYKIDKINYLPKYPAKLIVSILNNFGTFYSYREHTLFLTYYRTPFILKQVIEHFFEQRVNCQWDWYHFRSIHVGPSPKILGKNWLGSTTKVCDLHLLRIECLDFEVYNEIKRNGLDKILRLFPSPLEMRVDPKFSQRKTVLGDSQLGYGIALITDRHYLLG